MQSMANSSRGSYYHIVECLETAGQFYNNLLFKSDFFNNPGFNFIYESTISNFYE